MFEFQNNEKLKLPFSRHLEWMLILGTGEQQIKEFYDSVQMAPPSSKHFSAAKEKVNGLLLPPSTKQYLRRKMYREQDHGIWKKYGYDELYCFFVAHGNAKKNWTDLGKVLSHPVMRVALDCSIMTGLDNEEISALLPQQFNIALTETLVQLYRDNMFNVIDMTRNDWAEFLETIQEDTYSYTRYYAALTKPQAEVLHLVGLPSKNQFSDFLRNVLATADFKFRHYSRHNTPESNAEAMKWAKVGMDAGVKYEKFSSGDANDFSKLVQTQFAYDDHGIDMVTPEMIGGVTNAENLVKVEGASSGSSENLPAIADKAPDLPPPDGANKIFYG